MKSYVGTKQLKAKEMTLGEYNILRGWKLPDNEKPLTEGYLVEYSDGGEPNHPDYVGYISWSPKDVFERSYRANGEFTFGHALVALKAGEKVKRKGWNGEDQYLFLVQGSTFKVNRPPLSTIMPEGTEVNYRPHIDIKTQDGSVGTWSPSNSDALAEDWEIL